MNQHRRPAPKRHLQVLWLLVPLLAALGIASWSSQRCQNCVPSWFAFGTPKEPFTVLVMGTDVIYSQIAPRQQLADRRAFTGRSDTMLLVMVDPKKRTVRGINIPRDTTVSIPGFGLQKINAANAIGGPQLAAQTVASTLGVNVDHYVVVNVQGLVDAVNELGGVTVEVPKKLSYMDWTAKLKIDLEPGIHTLTGNQAMGFVRFRHDDLGDIGRIQRQQIFLRSIIAKLITPASWAHFPRLVEIAHNNVLSDMSDAQLFQVFNLVRSMPNTEVQFAMLPGRFGSYGSWVMDPYETNRLVEQMRGIQPASAIAAESERKKM